MGADYDDEISQGMNYRHWIHIKKFKNSATMTQQKIKCRMVTIRAENFITYDDAFFTASILSLSIPNLISVGMIQVGKQPFIVKQEMG